MRNILTYSEDIDGAYIRDIGCICSFENKDIANKICKKLNDFITNECAEYAKKELKKDIYVNDFILRDFLKEDKLKRILVNRLIEILDISKTERLVEELKKHEYAGIEEKTFRIKEIQEF